jgi:biopolymer transport protein ExbD
MAFGRFERSSTHAPMSEINVTPLVDVMLVLLVIFIITSPLMLGAIKLDLPKAQNRPAAQASEAVRVAIDAKGQVFLRDKAVELADLGAQLKSLAAQALSQNAAELPEIQLKADAQVLYGRVIEVMDAAQRAGLSRIGFVTESKAAPAKP